MFEENSEKNFSQKKTAVKNEVQYVNLQHGLFTNFNVRHLVSGVGCSKEENSS